MYNLLRNEPLDINVEIHLWCLNELRKTAHSGWGIPDYLNGETEQFSRSIHHFWFLVWMIWSSVLCSCFLDFPLMIYYTMNCVGQNKLFLTEIAFAGVFLSQQKKKKQRHKWINLLFSSFPSRPLQTYSFPFNFRYYWFVMYNWILITSSMFLLIYGNICNSLF